MTTGSSSSSYRRLATSLIDVTCRCYALRRCVTLSCYFLKIMIITAVLFFE